MDIETIKNQPDPSIRTLVFLYRQSEKMEIIRLIENSELSIKENGSGIGHLPQHFLQLV